MYYDHTGLTYTDKLRERLGPYFGKRVRFRLRTESGKTKRMSGILVGLWHRPRFGFIFSFRHLRGMGRYYGRMSFWASDIIWTAEIQQDFLMLTSGKEGDMPRSLP